MQKKANRYFIPIDGMPIEVSEEVYRAYYRPIWNTRYHAQKNGECRCTKTQFWKCDGVCPGCPFYAAGKKVSIDTAIGGEDDDLTLGDTLADNAPTADSILMDQELLKALYEELDRLDPEGQRICELMMHHSEREAAEIMGMARSTFKRHWAEPTAERVFFQPSWSARTAVASSAQRSGIPPTATAVPSGNAMASSRARNAAILPR